LFKAFQGEGAMDVATGASATLLAKIDKLLNEEYKLQPSIREAIKEFSQQMESLQDTLRKLGDVPGYQLDHQVKIWAAEVRQLSYNMQVVVDILLMPAPNSEGLKGLITGLMRLMQKMCSLLKTGKTHHQRITSKIKNINAIFRLMAERRLLYKIEGDDYRESYTTAIDPRLAALYTKRQDLVGIDGEKDQELMTLLSDGRNVPNNKMIVVSVVGIGGVGKTTLVKSVYDKIISDFDCTAFVQVGQNADAKKVMKDIILDLNRSLYMTVSLLDKQQFAQEILGMLQNKRYTSLTQEHSFFLCGMT
jgi:predicted ATPase